MRTLLLLRHAQTEDSRPGFDDYGRRLTADGRLQALAVGEFLHGSALQVQAVLCSPAVRARQTLEALRLGVAAETPDALYNAGADDILALVRELPDAVRTALVVGHAPGLPALAQDLADPEASDADALTTLGSRFPAGALAVLGFDGSWSELGSAALVLVRLP